MVYDLSRPPGARVRSLRVLCTECRVPRYEPVDRGALYRVVLPSYLVAGGDGFSMIRDENVKHDSGEWPGRRGVAVGYTSCSLESFLLARKPPPDFVEPAFQSVVAFKRRAPQSPHE